MGGMKVIYLRICFTKSCSRLPPSGGRCLHSGTGCWCRHELAPHSSGPAKANTNTSNQHFWACLNLLDFQQTIISMKYSACVCVPWIHRGRCSDNSSPGRLSRCRRLSRGWRGRAHTLPGYLYQLDLRAATFTRKHTHSHTHTQLYLALLTVKNNELDYRPKLTCKWNYSGS